MEQDEPLANSIMLTDKKKTPPRLATPGKPKKADQWNRTLIDMSNEAMLVCDLEYHIISWNHGAESLYGWSEQEAEGQISEVLLKARAPHSDADMQDALLQTGQWEGKVQYTHHDGHYVNVASVRKLIRDEDDQPTAILEVHRAINDPAHTEQILKTEIQEAEKQREMFLSIVGHELRTPLTTMSGNLQLARRRLEQLLQTTTLLPTDVQAFLSKLDNILEQSLRQTHIQDRLINDLLDISRLAVDKLELALQPCDLVTIVRETVEDLRFTGSRHEILLIEPAQPAIPVLIDPERVGQVMANYLTNALKYSPLSAPIIVEITLEADTVCVWVHDKGAGLSLDEQKHIWDRYYRVSDAGLYQNNGVNLGLGLYISRVLIKRLHGQVGVNSTSGKGSSFWFSLPLLKPTPSGLK